jgi:glyoxylase-like metal-dependent hydrolase (beta-lactamase superfamily II)
MKDHLVVFDAPIGDGHSATVLGLLRAKYPNKPVKFLVLTHHHMDHAGGLRAYAAQAPRSWPARAPPRISVACSRRRSRATPISLRAI